MSTEAFVTLATNDAYALGALTLAQSIQKVGTTRKLVVLISNHLSDLIRKSLEKSFDEVIVVDQLNSNDVEHLELLSRPELGITFTKINCWLLEQYTKCVFLDSDCLVLRPIDDLFEREELSAASDAGWPDCFNSGVFVYRPSKETFNKLMLFASQQNASFDGGDQGLLNSFFSNWGTGDISRHLPFTYNVTANAFYSYLPAVTRFRDNIHVVHFAGALKPWQLTYNPQNEQLSGNMNGQSDIQRDFLLSWWRIMHQRVWPIIQQFNQQTNSNDHTIDGQNQDQSLFIGSLNYENITENKGIEVGSAAHRRAWEAGHIDYFGRDSFSNIEQQLQRNIGQNLYQYHPTQPRQPSPETTIISQTVIELPTKTTSILKSSANGTTPIPQIPQPRPPPSHSEDLTKKSVQPPTTTTIPPKTPINEVKPISQPKDLSKPTPSTKTVSQTVTELPTTISVSKSSSNTTPSHSKDLYQKETRREPPTEQIITTRTTAVVDTVLNEVGMLSKGDQSIGRVGDLGKEGGSAKFLHQNITHLPTTTTIQSTNPNDHSSNLFKTSQESTTNLSPTVLKESTSLSQRQNTQSSTDPHQANWTVKSTIVTAYTQGASDLAGPIVINKSTSEVSATSSMKPISDSLDSSTLNETAKRSNEHFAWLFDKVFLAITYTIGLCYLLFLVALGRSKDTNIIHGNGTSVRNLPSSSTTNNGNRVKKDIQ